MSDCNHEVIAWRDENGKAHLWGCYQCRVKFVPMTQLDAEVKAEREACAKVCDARYMGDNNREDMEARRCAEAIRARGQA
jgi:hypothetical protein